MSWPGLFQDLPRTPPPRWSISDDGTDLQCVHEVLSSQCRSCTAVSSYIWLLGLWWHGFSSCWLALSDWVVCYRSVSFILWPNSPLLSCLSFLFLRHALQNLPSVLFLVTRSLPLRFFINFFFACWNGAECRRSEAEDTEDDGGRQWKQRRECECRLTLGCGNNGASKRQDKRHCFQVDFDGRQLWGCEWRWQCIWKVECHVLNAMEPLWGMSVCSVPRAIDSTMGQV